MKGNAGQGCRRSIPLISYFTPTLPPPAWAQFRSHSSTQGKELDTERAGAGRVGLSQAERPNLTVQRGLTLESGPAGIIVGTHGFFANPVGTLPQPGAARQRAGRPHRAPGARGPAGRLCRWQ